MLDCEQLYKFNKQEKNVAVVLAGNAGALAVIRNLGKNNVPVLAIGKNNFILKSKYCKGVRINDNKDIINILLKLPKYFNKKIVILTDKDEYMDLICDNWNILRDYYLTPIGDNLDSYKKLTTKSLLQENALKSGLNVPKTYRGKDQFAIKDFPVLVKPLRKDEFSKIYSKKAVSCNNYKELKKTLNIMNELGGSVTQEIVEGPTHNLYCITLYRNKFGRVILGNVVSKVREFPTMYGTGTTHLACYNDEVVEKSISLLNDTDFVGVAMIEYKYCHKEKKFYIIEVNGRFPLEISINDSIGNDFIYKMYLDIINPKQSDSNNVPYKLPNKPIIWMILSNDLRACISNKINFIKEYTNYMRNYIIEFAIWDKNDILPCIYYLGYLLKKVFHRYIVKRSQ